MCVKWTHIIQQLTGLTQENNEFKCTSKENKAFEYIYIYISHGVLNFKLLF